MIQFNKNNNMIEPFTIILTNRNQEFLGEIVNTSNMNFTGNFNAADELSFDVHKIVDGYTEVLWDEIYDLRLVFLKELNEYFEINVSMLDSDSLTKTITAKSLCEAELSQTMLYDIEINTETDIEREDYVVAKFWTNVTDPQSKEYKSTILYRVLEKVPAYRVDHVDSTLVNLQRVFSISGKSVYDWLVNDCATEFNCLVKFDSTNRTISFYDLYVTCPVCHARGLFNDICTHILTRDDVEKYGVNGLINGHGIGDQCGYTDLNYYGTDTTILVSTENLTDEIHYETDIDSVKNCFRLVAGDDDMTAAVININPNGSQYIYNFSSESLKDMPDILTQAISDYNKLYEEYKYRKVYNITGTANYKMLVRKYNDSHRYPASHDEALLSIIPKSIKGYIDVMKYIYEAMDFYSYLESSMMPTVEITLVNASTEAEKLTTTNLGGVVSLSSYSKNTMPATVENAILNLAKVHVKTGFVKVEINTSSSVYTYDSEGKITNWQGTFLVTNYSDEDDTATSAVCSLRVDGDYESFMSQKIRKKIAKDLEDDDFADSIFELDLKQFKTQLTYYSLNRLTSFKDSIEAVLGVLQEAGIAIDPSVQQDSIKKELYSTQYIPYLNKFKACEKEINTRAKELNTIATYTNGILTGGILDRLMKIRKTVQEDLNFPNYLSNINGTNDLYKLFTTYIRQDEYNNSNYISTGLENNDELFKMAQMFYDAAEEELLKSSTYQHSLTANLYNLLLLDEFAPIVNNFELGNWLRVKTDDNVYRLRLISYSVNFDDPSTLNTEFSDVTTTGLGYNDIQSILSQANSMATSYSAVTRQAELGKLANTSINEWVKRGLDSAKTRIMNNDTEEIEITNVGITAKTYNDITDTYDDEQLRITHNVLAFTDDNWETIKTALGKFTFTHHKPYESSKEEVTTEEYGLVANAVLAGWVVGSYFEAGDIIASHIQNIGHTTYIDLDEKSQHDYFVSVNNGRFTIDYDGTLTSYTGRFIHEPNNVESKSYIDIGDYDDQYPDWIHLNSIDDNGNRTLFKVSKKDASITSSGGHFQNLDDSNYIDLGGHDNNYDFLRCDGVFSVDKDGFLTSTFGKIGGFYIGDTFLATGVNTEDLSGKYTLNHQQNDVTLATAKFSAKLNYGTYDSERQQIIRDTITVKNLKFAIGDDFGVTDDGYIYCNNANIAEATVGIINANQVTVGDNNITRENARLPEISTTNISSINGSVFIGDIKFNTSTGDVSLLGDILEHTPELYFPWIEYAEYKEEYAEQAVTEGSVLKTNVLYLYYEPLGSASV